MAETVSPRPSRPVFVAGSRHRHRALSAVGAAVGLGLVAYLVVVVAALTGAPWVPDLGLPGVEPSDGRAARVVPSPSDREDARPEVAAAPATGLAVADRTTTASSTVAPTAAANPAPSVGPSATTPSTTPTTAPSVTLPPTTLPPPSQGRPPTDPGRPADSGRPADPGSNGQGTTHRSPHAVG